MKHRYKETFRTGIWILICKPPLGKVLVTKIQTDGTGYLCPRIRLVESLSLICRIFMSGFLGKVTVTENPNGRATEILILAISGIHSAGSYTEVLPYTRNLHLSRYHTLLTENINRFGSSTHGSAGCPSLMKYLAPSTNCDSTTNFTPVCSPTPRHNPAHDSSSCL